MVSKIRLERRLQTHPYNITKHFIEKTFTSRIRHGKSNQEKAFIIGELNWKEERKL